MTRSEVAEMLGVSKTLVRKLESSGRLHPTRRPDGVVEHSENEVLALAAERSGGQPTLESGTAASSLMSPAGAPYMGPEVHLGVDARGAWRARQIAAVVAEVNLELLASGYAPEHAAIVVSGVYGALCSSSDHELTGPHWPRYVASVVVHRSLGLPPPERPILASRFWHGLAWFSAPIRPIRPGD